MALKVKNVRAQFQEATERHIKILVAGPPGAGKTRSASTWPDPLYADVEGRLLSVRDRDVHAVDIKTVADLDELRSALAQDPKVREKILGVPVQTVILDTVDEISRLIIKERLKAEKQEAMRMPDWGYLGDTLRSLLRGYRNLDMNVVLNVHVRSETDSETGRMWEKPAIQGQVGDEIAAYVDEAVLLVARPTVDPSTGERVLQRHFQTYPDSAHTWVKDHSGTLPLEFPINLNDDYRRLSELIFGAAPGPQVERVAETEEAPALRKAAARAARTPIPEAGPPVVDVKLPAESVPESGTEPDLLAGLGSDASESPPEEPAPDVTVCADCGTAITNQDQIDISMARWQVPLCRQDFAGRKTRKR